MRRWLPAALLVLSLGLAACANDDATRDDTGAVATEGSVDAFAIELGDCVADPTAGTDPNEVAEVEEIRAIPCDQPHDGEVYHVFDMPDGEYPGEDGVAAAVAEGCEGAFADFVGLPYEESSLDYISLQPTQETWEQLEDREVVCIVADPSG
ncbi:MAG TPA: septum formation family protein, partial [Mycobacteriales bacterium]|nr:septum formation family protein [Mycobacteriales bacterium]